MEVFVTGETRQRCVGVFFFALCAGATWDDACGVVVPTMFIPVRGVPMMMVLIRFISSCHGFFSWRCAF